MALLLSVLEQGLIYGILSLGVYITYNILDFPDLTVDGSFPLGACVLAACLTAGIPPVAAIFIAFLSGLVAGIATSAIYTKLKIPDLLAGILTMTMLYSVNLRIMSNKANISFLKIETLFSKIQDKAYDFFFDMGLEIDVEWALVFFLTVFVAVLKILMDLFYHTDLGLTMGALGSNPQLIVSQGVNPDIVRTIGICFGNGLAALAGSFAAMYNGFADVGMGTGIVVSGLASLMLGEFIIKSNRIGLQTLRVFIGSIVYRALMILARSYGYKIHITPNDLKLVTGILIIICLIVSRTDLIDRLKSRKK